MWSTRWSTHSIQRIFQYQMPIWELLQVSWSRLATDQKGWCLMTWEWDSTNNYTLNCKSTFSERKVVFVVCFLTTVGQRDQLLNAWQQLVIPAPQVLLVFTKARQHRHPARQPLWLVKQSSFTPSEICSVHLWNVPLSISQCLAGILYHLKLHRCVTHSLPAQTCVKEQLAGVFISEEGETDWGLTVLISSISFTFNTHTH